MESVDLFKVTGDVVGEFHASTILWPPFLTCQVELNS